MRINIKSYITLPILLCFTFGLGGCLSIPTSPTSRFYGLSEMDENQVTQKVNIAADTIIGIDPVKIPEYLDRPQIVTETKARMIQFAQFDRWGESLDVGLARLIRADLAAMLPQAKLILYPWNPAVAVKYQVVIEVLELRSALDGEMFLDAQWMIINTLDSKTEMIKRFQFHQPIDPQNYTGLAKTLSTACASLSGQIAQSLGNLKKGNQAAHK